MSSDQTPRHIGSAASDGDPLGTVLLDGLDHAPRTVVGVEFASAEPALVVHAVGNLLALTRAFGMAACGLPAEYLTLVPELPWADVHRCLRCGYCDAEQPADG